MTESPHDKLRRARQARGYRFASDLAQAAGWNEATYRSHENGTRTITLDAARRYASFLGLAVADLFDVELPSRDDKLNAIEMVGKVAFGLWRDERIDQEKQGFISVPGPGNGVQRKAVEVVDESVSKVFAQGDYAIFAPIDENELHALHDKLVVVERHRDGLVERTVRRVKKQGGRVVLATDSNDPKFTDHVSYPSNRENEVIKIVGQVVGRYSDL